MPRFIIFIFCFLALKSATAQIPSLPGGTIPDEQTLRRMGVSPDQIEQLLDDSGSRGTDPAVDRVLEKMDEALPDHPASAPKPIVEALEKGREQAVTLIAEELSQELPPATIYGQDFFRNNKIEFFENASGIKAPDNYIIGSGDELSIQVWGFSDYSETFRVNREGFIQPREVGRIYLKDLTFEQAKDLIVQRFGNFLDLSHSKIDVTLVYSRVITVNMVGEVFVPGAYKIPAINTAFNALVKAGGPNEIGSIRKIYIKRGGKTIKTLDVYEYLLNPNSTQDFFLQDNDYIFIPPRGRVVTVSGEVKRPHKFELIPGEHLAKTLEYAGGIKPGGFEKTIQIKRFGESEEVLLDVDFQEIQRQKKDYELDAGDQIMVFKLPEWVARYVETKGAFRVQGQLEYRKGTRVTDLIERAQGLMPDAFTERAYIKRLQPDMTRTFIPVFLDSALANPAGPHNFVLEEYDILQVFSKSSFTEDLTVRIVGAVRQPGYYPFGDGITIKDLILAANGLTINAYTERAYIKRINEDLTKEFIPINLDSVLKFKEANIALQRDDEVEVFFKASFREEYVINISGAIRQPGEYPYYEGTTLKDLLYFAGGLKREAANTRIEISRVLDLDQSKKYTIPIRTLIQIIEIGRDLELDPASEQFLLQPQDHVFVRTNPDFELQKTVYLEGEVKYPGAYSIAKRDERLTEIIERAGGLTEFASVEAAKFLRQADGAGFLFLDLKKAIQKPKSRLNYLLRDGDVIKVPRMSQLIQITGAVKYPNIEDLEVLNAPYFPGRRAKFYVNRFGAGFQKRAIRKRTYVQFAGGEVKRTKNFLLFKVYPRVEEDGLIYVERKPTKQEKQPKEKTDRPPVDWNAIIQSTSASVVSVLTIYLLVTTIKNR